jgi:hypothetical protein
MPVVDDPGTPLHTQAMLLGDGRLTFYSFQSRVLTRLTYTSRQGNQHRGQTAGQETTKARNKNKLQGSATASERQAEPQTADKTG